MKNLRKDNKGFSLVELIVVVLIMAIIAVALAPQVMKWVKNSRESADANNYDSLYANVQLALADKKAYEEVTKTANSGKTITLTTSTTKTTLTTTGTATDFKAALTTLDNGWEKIARKVTDAASGDYTITVTCGTVPVVTKSNAPSLTSPDLQ